MGTVLWKGALVWWLNGPSFPDQEPPSKSYHLKCQCYFLCCPMRSNTVSTQKSGSLVTCDSGLLCTSRMLKSTFANSVWDSLTACSELYKCICCLISYRWFMWVSRKRNRDVWEKLASKDSVGLSPLPPCHLGLYRTNKGITGPSQHFLVILVHSAANLHSTNS